MAPTRDASTLDSQHPAEQRGRRVRTGLCRPHGAAELQLALGLHLGLWHMAQPDELRAPGSACAITPSSPRCPEALPPACPSLALQQPMGTAPCQQCQGWGCTRALGPALGCSAQAAQSCWHSTAALGAVTAPVGDIQGAWKRLRRSRITKHCHLLPGLAFYQTQLPSL